VEDSPYDHGLGFVDFEASTVRILAAAISEAPAARMEAATDKPFETAADALRCIG
jgi:hypothetical protein